MKLKNYLSGIFLQLPLLLCAQTTEDIGKIVLGVRFVDDISSETKKLQPQLENKLIMFATQSGYSSFGDNIFFITPNIVINDINVAEGGMKNIYVVNGDLYLTIRDSDNGTIYSSASYPFKGSGTNKDVAIKNAILNISYPRVQELFSEAKEKILSYYTQQQSHIFAHAELCAKEGNYDEAIAYLMMIPEELTDLHIQALGKASDIYTQRDKAIYRKKMAETYHNNESIIANANSLLAMHKPQEALRILWNYRGGNEHLDAQYSSLINKAENLVSATEAENLRKEERAYRDNKLKDNREWEEKKLESAHKRDMDRRELELKNQIVSAAERVAHDEISVKKQAIASAERVAHDNISAKKQAIASTERVLHHRADVDNNKIEALKTIACEYIKKNPRSNYLHINY